jgi:hypothetical protein
MPRNILERKAIFVGVIPLLLNICAMLKSAKNAMSISQNCIHTYDITARTSRLLPFLHRRSQVVIIDMSVLLMRRRSRKRIFLSFVRNCIFSSVRVDCSIPRSFGKRTRVPTENPQEIIPIKNRSLSKLSLCR